ncbi:MAG: hypothetical protein Tsb0015_16770 [Simkaniaceae bacterium]
MQEIADWPKKKIRDAFGGKALGLSEAFGIGLPVPQTWLLEIELFFHFFQNGKSREAVIRHLSEQFPWDLLPDVSFAVRSSSNFEDSSLHSYAGVFETKLHIPKEDIPNAIYEVWESCSSLKASSYSEEQMQGMGVILQPMIAAKYSGVCFSRHPSPGNVFENHHMIVEFVPAEGEKVVQGEVTPLRLSGTPDSLLHAFAEDWLHQLLHAAAELKVHCHHGIDIEFAVDEKENFYLLQQRPISSLHASKNLDLKHYERKFKRSLLILDIEFLIEGCSVYLPSYLEFFYRIDDWMVMITAEDGQQELWTHKALDAFIVQRTAENILSDEEYLLRITQRYYKNQQKMRSYPFENFILPKYALSKRFLDFYEFACFFAAHYYVPMLVIEALHQILLQHFLKVSDRKQALQDLFFLGTFEIQSLSDILHEELRKTRREFDLKNETDFEDLPPKAKIRFSHLAQEYGFLKSRSFTEEGFGPEELWKIAMQQPEEKALIESEKQRYLAVKSKYIRNETLENLFAAFREWMKIRNQEMEFYYHALLQARPLFLDMARFFDLTEERLWNASKEQIYQGIKKNNPTIVTGSDLRSLAIFRADGKTHVKDDLHIVLPQLEKTDVLRGKTIYGTGILQAKIKLCFDPQQLENFDAKGETYVLVTGMTTPDFVPYLKKHFSALITDEGGILCHAAIVAREIGLPAIIGTGFATSQLQDGMWVALNFDSGEVKKK